VLAPDQLVTVSRVVLLLVSEAAPREIDERAAFTRLRDLQEAVVDAASLEGGAIVKIHREGVMAAFVESVAATRAALVLMESRPAARTAMHAGSMMVTTINGRLDYYGRVVQEADAILDRAEPGTLLLSEAVTSHPDVPRLVLDREVGIDLVGPSSLLVQIVGAPRASRHEVADTDVGALASGA
jgi:class 3 adenylate cyclase